MQSAVASLTTTPVPLRRESSIAGSSKDLLPLTPAQIKQKAREVNLQGLEANRAGDTKVALSCFERAHELDPDEASYLLSAANMTLKVERLQGTSARSRRSALMYMKVLEFPALPPRLAEKARAKLEEVQAAQELDAERELSLGSWAGGAEPRATRPGAGPPPQSSPRRLGRPPRRGAGAGGFGSGSARRPPSPSRPLGRDARSRGGAASLSGRAFPGSPAPRFGEGRSPLPGRAG